MASNEAEANFIAAREETAVQGVPDPSKSPAIGFLETCEDTGYKSEIGSADDHGWVDGPAMLDLGRQRETLFGLAVGDALGAAVEFQMPGIFPEVTGYRGGGPHDLEPGQWTDDSSMALALADSIASVGWDLNDQARRYVAWWREGKYSVNGRCFDIGSTTRSALSRFRKTGDARTSGDPSEQASGNGSIMRLAPVPIRYAGLFPDRLDELITLLMDSSRPTHASPHRLSAYRNELESMSEIPRLNSRAREDGVRAWPPDPVFAPPTRRTERPGDAPLRSRGPTRQNIHRPIRDGSRPRKVNRGSGQRSPGPPIDKPPTGTTS